MKDKRIKAMKSCFELKLIKNIQVFIRFANFYWSFIQSLSKITALLTSMLKIAIDDTDGNIENKKQNCFGKKISKTTKSKSTKLSSGLGFLTTKTRIAFT